MSNRLYYGDNLEAKAESKKSEQKGLF